jgi:hypothetical protein
MYFNLARLKRIGITLLVWAFLAAPARAVDRNVPDDFATIQAAIAAAVAGDRILIEPGTHTGNILLNKSDIELIGDETARTFVGATSGNVMSASNVSGIIIRNLTFIDGAAGIALATSTDIDIRNNVFALSDAATAIFVDIASVADIRHNTFYNNDIAIVRAANTTIIKNNIFFSNDTAVTDDGAGTGNISFNCFATGDTPIGTDFPPAGDVRFVNVAGRDFHLRDGSDCIDAGDPADANDVFDDSVADAGAYGGAAPDTRPLAVGQPDAVVNEAATPGLYNITLSWDRNLSYLTTSLSMPYKIYYDSDESGAPYEGDDADDSGGNPIPSPVAVADVDTFTLYNLLSSPVVPDAPELEAAAPSNRSLDLRWSAADDATGYRVEYGIASVDENSVNVGNVTAYEIGDLENGLSYRVRVSALLQTRYFFALGVLGMADDDGDTDESPRSGVRSVAVGPAQASAPSNELIGIPERVEPYPALPDQGDTSCFIATAAYGHYSHPQVQLLRDFRDRYLLTNPPGRVFTGWYYRHSPAAAAFIARHDTLRMLVRWALLPFIGIAWLMLHTPMFAVAATALCLVAMWRRRGAWNFFKNRPRTSRP